MCTLTVRRDTGLLVTMNRDELLTRAPELPPRDHGDWVGPQDGERLGTWFGVNRQGVVACLLNDYPETDDEPAMPTPTGPSRGELIPRLLARGPAPAILEALQAGDLEPFSPFMLFCCSPGGGWLARWRDELTLETVPTGWSMWTSSGWRSHSVGRWRQQRFAEWQAHGRNDVQGVPAFNLLSVPGEEWSSPLAARGVSGTRSVTQAEVKDGEVHLRYWPKPHWPPQKPTAYLTFPLGGGAHTAAKPDPQL